MAAWHTGRRTVRWCLAGIFMLVSGAHVWAQPAGSPAPAYMESISVGVRGGYGSSSLSIQPYLSTRSTPMVDMGLYIALRSTRHLALVMEPSFKRTAYASNYPPPLMRDIGAKSPYHVRQEWIYFPALLEMRLHIGWASLEASAGTYGDYLLSERVQSGIDAPVAQRIYSTERNKLGLGLLGGAGIGVNTKWGSIVVGYRAAYRLTNTYIQERRAKLQEPRSNMREQLVSVSYYYTIDLIKPL